MTFKAQPKKASGKLIHVSKLVTQEPVYNDPANPETVTHIRTLVQKKGTPYKTLERTLKKDNPNLFFGRGKNGAAARGYPLSKKQREAASA